MIFRQLFDAASSTYTYLLGDGAECVLVDPVFEQHARDAALVRELGLTLVATLDTHCHADHVTGAWRMKRAFGSRIALSSAYRAANVDLPLAHGDEIRFGSRVLHVRATPGHTDGCLSFVDAARAFAITGDALLVRGAGRTDFQNGDAHRLFRSIREQLFTLPDACLVHPAHDYEGRTVSSIGEERAFNPRIGGAAREEDFVGYMQNLGLAHPRQLDVALPANLRAGRPEHEIETTPGWGPVVTTYGGTHEIAPDWVRAHRHDVTLLDVRNPSELEGELGALQGSRVIPLNELRARSGELPRASPIVVVCQSGKRSALGAAILGKAGFTEVASLAGGMLRWRELDLPD